LRLIRDNPLFFDANRGFRNWIKVTGRGLDRGVYLGTKPLARGRGVPHTPRIPSWLGSFLCIHKINKKELFY